MKGLCLCLINILLLHSSFAIQRDTIPNNISNNLSTKLHKKITALNRRIKKQSLSFLKNFESIEKRILMRSGLDSLSIEKEINEVQRKSIQFQNQFDQSKDLEMKPGINDYNSHLDSLYTAFKFICIINDDAKIRRVITDLKVLQANLNSSNQLKNYISGKTDNFLKLTNENPSDIISCNKEIKSLSKSLYYYKAQLEEFKEVFNEPVAFEKKALEILETNPNFKNFMNQNSILSNLFNIQKNFSGDKLEGLQSKIHIETLINNTTLAGGQNAKVALQGHLADAKNQIDNLRSQINKSIKVNSQTTPKDFHINSEKTKPFIKRLEYGFNLQFEKSSKYLPSASNIGVSLSYKKNQNLVVGIGCSYKLGIGTISKIQFSNQGIGFRGFSDYKIKNHFYASGGYEMNFNAGFKSIKELKIYNAWQQSALLGMSKRFKISTKVKYEIKLYYDLLAQNHFPTSQPFVFRIGYLK